MPHLIIAILSSSPLTGGSVTRKGSERKGKVCVCLSVCEQVFSRAVSAVGTERGGMDKHHGRSVQQETGAALVTERRSPAAI